MGEDTTGAWKILITGQTKDAVGDINGVEMEQIDTVPPGAESAYRLVYDRPL